MLLEIQFPGRVLAKMQKAYKPHGLDLKNMPSKSTPQQRLRQTRILQQLALGASEAVEIEMIDLRG